MKKLTFNSLLLPVTLCLGLAASPAKAVLSYTIYEVAGSVVIEAIGSLNLPSPPTSSNQCGFDGAIIPAIATVCTGDDSILNLYQLDSGPISFLGNELYPASSVGTLSTLLVGASGYIGLEPTYQSGDPIVSSAIFNGKTLADFGLTLSSGTLGTWTLGNETITLKVVPGPLPILGAGAAFGFTRRLRQRTRWSEPSSKG